MKLMAKIVANVNVTDSLIYLQDETSVDDREETFFIDFCRFR